MNQTGDEGPVHGYWGGFVWQDGELARRWIFPRPADLPGDERAWFDSVMFGTTPKASPTNDGDWAAPELTVNQAHHLEHRNERLSNGYYFAVWWTVVTIFLLVFFQLTHNDASTTDITPFATVVVPPLFAGFMTFARRHPLIALGIVAGLTYLSHESDKRHAARASAEHQARVEALLGKIAQQMHPDPPDYTGPAGFGRY